MKEFSDGCRERGAQPLCSLTALPAVWLQPTPTAIWRVEEYGKAAPQMATSYSRVLTRHGGVVVNLEGIKAETPAQVSAVVGAPP